jgi:WD40 repeat protein
MFTIGDAHKGGVTALKIFSDCGHIISGGKEGGIRIWSYEKNYLVGKNEQRYVAKLLFALKEHKAMVTCIAIRSNNEECVSSSTDGSCIVWDLINRCRKHMIHVNTLFQYICYHPAEYQLITTGSDKKISYYESYDASMIRELEGAKTGSINSMDLTSDGKYIVSAGEDKLVRVWLYDEGQVIAIGVGHSAPIQRAKFSPCERYILSVSSDGAILTWHSPWMRQMGRQQNMQQSYSPPPNAESPVEH